MSDLKLEIDHEHEHNGWINCYLTFNGVRNQLDASGALPTFLPMLYFTKQIAGRKLPAKFIWDEEGIGAAFTATLLENTEDKIHLLVQHSQVETPWIDADLDRMEVVQAFLPALRSCSRSKIGAGWDLPSFAVDSVERAIEQGTLFSESEIIIHKIGFLLHGTGYDMEELTGAVALHLWLDDTFVDRWDFMDTSVFWPQWFDFLEKVAKNDLPTIFSFVPERIQNTWLSALGLGAIDELTPKREYSFWSNAGADSSYVQFELKGVGGESNYPDLKVRINPREFVQAFCDTFEDFLETAYKVSADEQGYTFDLLQLPVDRVRKALAR